MNDTTNRGVDPARAREPSRAAEALLERIAVSGTLGRYEVLGTLGKGGMGTVLRAHDRELDRQVALKVLHGETDRHHTIRLRREAQAMAKLSHPNVVQVYEVGELEGQTFVAMELVEGQTLSEWIGQEPRPGWRACVRVYEQLGAGLAAAHQQGLVHRDFKPGNAIMDDEGRPRVLDFGLARQTGEDAGEGRSPSVPAGEGRGRSTPRSGVQGERELERTHDPAALAESITKTGAMLGTLAYMPPEQMGGYDIDARSDQFSFCVSLYEALYGERPFEGSSMMALMVSMSSGGIRPAPRGTAVPVALRKVLLRGLAVDPSDRWPSMEALLGRLRALSAPRRRRRWLALSVGLGLLAIGAGLGVERYAAWSRRCTGARVELRGTWDDARKHDVRAALLDAKLSYGLGTWERVEQRLDDYADAWAAKHVEICEATRSRGEQSEQDMSRRMACLYRRKMALQGTVGVLASADATVVRNATKLVVGLPGLDRCDDLEALRASVTPPQDPQVAQDIGAQRERLAQIRAEELAGLYAQALEDIEPVVARAEALGYAPLLAEAKALRGSLREQTSDYDEAERDLLEAHALAMEHRHDPVVLDALQTLTFVVGVRLARPEEGAVWGHVALTQATRIGDEVGYAESLGNLAVVLKRQGKYAQAQEYYEQALERRERLLGAEHLYVTMSLNNLGNVLYTRGEYERAKALQRRALEIRTKVLGAGHPHVAQSLDNLGVVLHAQGEYEQARRHFERALEIRRAALGAEHPDVAANLSNLGNVSRAQGRYDEAERHQRRALGILQEALGAEHPRVAQIHNNLGRALRGLGRLEEAQHHFERSLGIVEKRLGAEHPKVADGLDNLGSVLFAKGEHAQAEVHLERALRVREATAGAEHPKVAEVLAGLVELALAQDDLEAARVHAERGLSIREAQATAPELLAEARFGLARALGSDPSQQVYARTLAERARDAYAALGDAEAEHLAAVEAWLTEHRGP